MNRNEQELESLLNQIEEDERVTIEPEHCKQIGFVQLHSNPNYDYVFYTERKPYIEVWVNTKRQIVAQVVNDLILRVNVRTPAQLRNFVFSVVGNNDEITEEKLEQAGFEPVGNHNTYILRGERIQIEVGMQNGIYSNSLVCLLSGSGRIKDNIFSRAKTMTELLNLCECFGLGSLLYRENE